MTQKDWNAIVNPPPLFRAKFLVEGEETEEVTSGSTVEEAKRLLQPGWRVEIKVLSVNPSIRL